MLTLLEHSLHAVQPVNKQDFQDSELVHDKLASLALTPSRALEPQAAVWDGRARIASLRQAHAQQSDVL